MEFNPETLISIVLLITAIIIHEVAHGVVADKLGDPTARLQGRLTLNPLLHLDPIGSVVLPLLMAFSGTNFLFGWAKPVPYNPYNLKNVHRDELLIALAGPVSNILLAILSAVVLKLAMVTGMASEGLLSVFSTFITLNLFLAFFNLVPIPPLDGSKVLFGLLPARFLPIRHKLEQFGPVLVLAIFFITPLRMIILGPVYLATTIVAQLLI